MHRVNQSMVRASLKAAMNGRAGPTIFIVMVLAGLAYLTFGDMLGASPMLKPENSASANAVAPTVGRGASRNEKISSSFSGPTDYFPAGYANQGRDGDGNIKTYEHD